MTEYAFTPDVIHIVPGQELRIVNDGAQAHAFYLPDLAKGAELQPGDRAALQLPPDIEGEHVVICDLRGHREAGMVATVIVD
jgi:plastocyanin